MFENSGLRVVLVSTAKATGGEDAFVQWVNKLMVMPPMGMQSIECSEAGNAISTFEIVEQCRRGFG